ncbi:MAG: DUF3418 domain-containing protein, partial [Bacteroidetes bacterium]|nr:DUF3418 domain-containing protein [Bacteroidota bacterium]
SLRRIALQLATLINPGEVKQDMLTTITDQAFVADDVMPRNEQDFVAQKQIARSRLPAVTDSLTSMMQKIGNEYQSLMMYLSKASSGHHSVCGELNMQLGHLIYPGFLNATQWERLQHFPRYLRGMSMRLDKFSANPKRDEQYELEISKLWCLYKQRLDKHRQIGIDDPNLVEFRWQIEELRISLFAQELKTPYPVSIKRLQKLWEKTRA